MRCAILALTAAIVSAANVHGAITIDLFMTQQMQAGVGSNTLAAAEAIGGQRTLTIDSISPGMLTAELAVGPEPVRLTLSNDVGESSNARVVWDAAGAGLGGVDLTQGGLINNAFNLSVDSIDIGLVDLELLVSDTAAGSSAAMLLNLGAGNVSVPFADFVGDVDFTLVDSLALRVMGGPSSDLEIRLISVDGDVPEPVIPEPSTAIVFALLGCVAMGTRKLRR